MRNAKTVFPTRRLPISIFDFLNLLADSKLKSTTQLTVSIRAMLPPECLVRHTFNRDGKICGDFSREREVGLRAVIAKLASQALARGYVKKRIDSGERYWLITPKGVAVLEKQIAKT